MHRTLNGRVAFIHPIKGKMLYPAIDETKKNALIGNLNSTYPLSLKTFHFSSVLLSDFALTHGNPGFNLPELNKDKRSSAYAEMSAVRHMMVRSLTDWFRKCKAKKGIVGEIELADDEDAAAVSGFHLLEALSFRVDLSFLCYISGTS